VIAGRRLVRTLYTRSLDVPALGRALASLRSHPRVRAFARRHVDLLLASGTTWANVDAALRLLAEDQDQPIVFGPWRGDLAAELLYWAPFVRWAREHFALDPARVTVVSRGPVGHWYAGACGTYVDLQEDGGAGPSGAATISPSTVLALADEYRSGAGALRPLLKRARHVRLAPPHRSHDGLPEHYLAVALEPAAAFAVSNRSRQAARESVGNRSAGAAIVDLEEADDLYSRHALLGGATGLVASWGGLALLGLLSGIPTVAVTSVEATPAEPDVDLALRVASKLGTSLAVIDAAELGSLTAAIAGCRDGSRGAPPLQWKSDAWKPEA
jgi:hypothetical protein